MNAQRYTIGFHRRVIFLIFIFIFGYTFFVKAQFNPFLFRHITTDDGLAGNDVRSILQDSRGFMWFATDNGLQKYDGKSFYSYHHNPLDSQSLYSDNLFTMVQDKQNNLWILSFLSGITKLDPITNTCFRISNLSEGSFKDLFLTRTMFTDSAGNIWMLAADRINCYLTKSNRLISLDTILPAQHRLSFYDAIYDRENNRIWVADRDAGICMLDLSKNIFYSPRNNPDNVPIFKLECRPTFLFLDKEKNLWIDNFEGNLIKYNLASDKYETYSFNLSTKNFSRSGQIQHENTKSTNSLAVITEDDHGNIWMTGAQPGLFQYIVQKDSFNLIPADPAHSNGLHFSQTIHCIYSDREGNVWVGTDRGINVFNPSRQQFHFFENEPANKIAGRKVETMDFLQNGNGELLIASWGGGITSFNPLLGFEKSYVHHSNDPNSLGEADNRVWSMVKSSNGKIIVGCQHAHVAVFDPGTKKFFNSHPDGLANRTVMNMKADTGETIWTALYFGIGEWNTKTGKAAHYTQFLPYEGIDSGTASDLWIDRSENIWVGTLGLGLQKFDRSLQKFTRIFVPQKNNPHSISSAVINCLIPINDTTIAIGTGNGGIDIFNTVTEQFRSFTIADGLPFNNIAALLFIPPSSLWAASGNVLLKIDLRTGKVLSFGSQDGITDLDFYSCRHMYKMQDGRILVGYTGGFLYFNPDSISSGGSPPDVTLTGIKVFDQFLSLDSLLQKTGSVSLSYKQNFITINFASLSYRESNRINYYYQLEGIDHDWVNAHAQRFATYTDLPPGNYLFKVRCENSESISSSGITQLMITIQPPFWKTWWFELLMVVLVLIALYSLYRYRINQLMHLQMMRNEISRDLHDDVGSTLSSISILSQEASYRMREGEQEQSSSILYRINSYAQDMVEKMGDIVWAVNAGNNNIGDILPRLKNYFIEICSSKGIRLEFHTDPELERRMLPMQARKNFYLICKEAINNAIKYSGCQKITVHFRLKNPGIEIMIEDDGKGFDVLNHPNGNGLKNMQARAGELKGTLTINSGPQGTKILLKIPVPKIR